MKANGEFEILIFTAMSCLEFSRLFKHGPVARHAIFCFGFLSSRSRFFLSAQLLDSGDHFVFTGKLLIFGRVMEEGQEFLCRVPPSKLWLCSVSNVEQGEK